MTANSKLAHQDEHFYDIIGDVHGHHLKLQHLLIKLGYSLLNGVWTHAYRTAVFVGDFIDRGPNSRGVINAIRDMVNAGTALAILGNHEVNAIFYFTKDDKGRPLRLPGNSNARLLNKFEQEYHGNTEALKKDIKWLRTLPLFLELNGIRVVHAYWNDAHIDKLRNLHRKGKLKKRTLKKLRDTDTALGRAFAETIKGVELKMPRDLVIKDADNIKRDSFRVKWWCAPTGKTFKELSYGNKFELPDYTVPTEIMSDYAVYPKEAPLVFVGHYCMGRGPLIPTSNVCCVDACVTGTGRLAAYRYNGEKEPSADHFVFGK
ncbi:MULTISPECIES: metallophosphoesterase [unclassified Carboxylicivirga]|uniref:metallophosphoesterase n=1 Tax=Carboxylicivirga TaxID=1628153 RepID=UPI003D3537D0